MYGHIPYPDSGTSTTCFLNQQVPNNVYADAAINDSSHEMFEAITNPDGYSWADNNYPVPNEIGDKCSTSYPSPLPFTAHGTTPDADLKMLQSGSTTVYDYYTSQAMWSNFFTNSGQNTGCTLTPGSGQMMTGSIYSVQSGSGNHEIHAYNTSDGTSRWSYVSGVINPFNTPLQYNGRVFFADSNTSQLRSLNASTGADTGNTYNLAGNSLVFSSGVNPINPIESNNNIIVSSVQGSSNNYMDAFSATCGTCNTKWQVALDSQIAQTPTVSNNVLYVATQNKIEAFDITATSASLKWSVNLTDIDSNFTYVTAPITVDNGVMFFGGVWHFGVSFLYAIQPTLVGSTWTFPKNWRYNLNGSAYDKPTVNSGVVYLVNVGYPPQSNTIDVSAFNEAYNATQQKWTVNLSSVSSFVQSPVTVAGTALYFGSYNGVYSLKTLDGTLRWHVQSGNQFYQIYTTNGNTFVGGPLGILDLNNSNGSIRVGVTSNSSLALNLSLNND